MVLLDSGGIPLNNFLGLTPTHQPFDDGGSSSQYLVRFPEKRDGTLTFVCVGRLGVPLKSGSGAILRRSLIFRFALRLQASLKRVQLSRLSRFPEVFQKLFWSLNKEIRIDNPPIGVRIGVVNIGRERFVRKTDIFHHLNVDYERYLC